MEDTSASAPEAVEAVEAAAVDTAEATGEAPETVEQAEAVETPKRPSWSDELAKVEAISPQAAELMRKMQGDYTRKTQELAKTRKEMLREREALQRGAAKIAAPEELGEFDPFNEASVQARIEAEVARRLQDVLQPMQQEYELMAAEEAYQGFLQAHPDFESDVELRAEVQQALESSPSLDLETAYYAVQGRRARHQAAETQQRSAAERKARREAAVRGTGMPRKGGAPVRPNGRDLKKMSSADILALAKQLAAGR
jgi:hypothetical protein